MGRGSLAWGGCRCRARGVLGWLTAVAVLLAITVGIPAGARAAEDAAVASTPLNLRAEPGTWAPIVGLLWPGEPLALLAGPTSDNWYQVQAGEQTGWAYGGGLSLGGAVETSASASEGLGGEQANPSGGGESPPSGGGGLGGEPTAPEPAAAGESAERWVDVNRSTQTVTLFEGDVALSSYWAAMGSDPSDDGFFATAVGTYYVYEKYGGLSWTNWGGAWVADWVGFDANRLNGFHTYSMDGDGQVLPGGDGPTGGCVALAPAAADQLFAFVSVGTRVEVHR